MEPAAFSLDCRTLQQKKNAVMPLIMLENLYRMHSTVLEARGIIRLRAALYLTKVSTGIRSRREAFRVIAGNEVCAYQVSFTQIIQDINMKGYGTSIKTLVIMTYFHLTF